MSAAIHYEDVLPLPKKSQTLPVVLSPEEVQQFLGFVESLKHRAILTTCYAAGLRISEAVHLTPTAIDSQRMVIRVEQGNGQKDRHVLLSLALLAILRNYWRTARSRDWLFPGDRLGEPLTRDAVGNARHKAHRLSGLSKPVTQHNLRHAFAVHLLEAGTVYLPTPRRAEATVCRLERILGQGGDDDVERILAGKTRGVDGGAHIRFGLGGPQGAIAVGNLSLDHTGPQLAL